MKKIISLLLISVITFNCKNEKQPKEEIKETIQVKTPFDWKAANVYFLLTDRFNNGDKSNDVNFNRTKETGVLRGFKGGDLKGITQKIEAGYFTDLGINAIWMTPIVEQIHGATDEGTGNTYGYHGYWTKDWTAIDPNFGTSEDLKTLVDTAHKNGIRILLDAVINHTGPATEIDPAWPEEWVRTAPKCEFTTYENTTTCTLVTNLPDIKTESNDPVNLPPQLVEKWKAEGRYDQEVAELDTFFKRTGYPRAPRFYIMKWLADYITDYGIDGYRVDTVKHTEEYVWQEFRRVCDDAFHTYKKNNPEKVLDDNHFYLVGEVYNYAISTGQYYDFGDKKVNYFEPRSFDALINFELKWNSKQLSYEQSFKKYDSILNSSLKDYGTLSYLTSHDDGQPFDKERQDPYETANRLLLSPGASQVYYGDESARSLIIDGTEGDATLRSFMNWNAVNYDASTKAILNHWQKLGQFRAKHPAIGAGRHEMISETPYVFSRKYQKGDETDKVVICMQKSDGKHKIKVAPIFNDGEMLRDHYSGQEVKVKNSEVTIETDADVVLLEKI